MNTRKSGSMANELKTKPPSHIPVMAPRPSQSTLPSSLSTPQLGLVSPGKYLAVSGSPSYPPAFGNNSQASGTSGGLAPFRSFRNLLSFGSVKASPTRPIGAIQSAAASRTSFGNPRRSSNGERSVSTPHLVIPKVQEEAPALKIELSHRVDEPLFDKDELRSRLCMDPSSPQSASASPSPLSSCASIYGADQPVLGMSDLSTIMEAESSGISKHLPSLDESSVYTSRSIGTRISPRTIAARSLPPHGSDGQETSLLDLSTTNISKEVLAALSDAGRQEGWLSGIVVEDADAPGGDQGATGPDVSFNLSALDDDLAAILRPSRAQARDNTRLAAIQPISPSSRTSPLTEGIRPSPTPSPRMASRDIATAHFSPARSPTSASRAAASTSHLGRSASSRLVPPTSLTRLSRSSSEKPTFFAKRSPASSPTRPETLGRTSLQLPRKNASPLLGESLMPKRPTSSEGKEAESRKPALSRLVSPSRHLAASNNARAASRQLPSPSSSPGWDVGDSVSSRSPSTIGIATTRRLNGQRPSLDIDGERAPIQGRDRSASLSENPSYHPPAPRQNDWLGPRTAKAFAAAGLLDDDRDTVGPSASRPGSRFGLGASRSERDFRSQYAPSRAGYSEVGSSTSWGRRSGSISRTVGSSETVSVLGTPNSDSTQTTPRTTYSGASTAATSVSAVSSMHKHLETEFQLLHERHSTETGALLNALADSQRTTRMLREENAQLRERVHCLEDELVITQEALQKMQSSPSQRHHMYRTTGRHMTEPLRRPLAQSRLQTLLHPAEDDLMHEQQQDVEEQHQRHLPLPIKIPSKHSLREPETDEDRRRFSNTSSIFPAPPSNMPMLLNEDGGSMSMSPPSPPFLAKLSMRQGHHRRTSSVGNISPTTANFSIMSGSPRSLDLRPEHEHLLEDMPSLDLHADDHELHAYHG